MAVYPPRGLQDWDDELKNYIDDADIAIRVQSDSRYATAAQGTKADAAAGDATAKANAIFVGTALGTVDLNTVTIPGMYSQAGNASATLVRNYPSVGNGGILKVENAGAADFLMQTFTLASGLSGLGRVFYKRRLAGSTWSPWQAFSAQRIVQGTSQPGAEVFTWDEVNNVERQIEVISTALGTGSNLNAITVPGKYYQQYGSQATEALNYPPLNSNGSIVIEVLRLNDTDRLQRLTPAAGTGRANSGIYQRSFISSVWSAWRLLAAQRVDQTAGRAIYVYDDVNNREQLIYGDTGWRNVTTLSPYPGPDQNRIRRIGQQVFVQFSVQAPNPTITPVPSLTLPVGFQAVGEGAYLPRAYGNTAVYFDGTKALFFAMAAGAVDRHTFSFPANDPWPTALPGTAIGGIPNA